MAVIPWGNNTNLEDSQFYNCENDISFYIIY